MNSNSPSATNASVVNTIQEISMNNTINGMSYQEIDKLTSQNANPANSNLKYTNTIDSVKLWNTPLIPNAAVGLAHVFGQEVAEKLMFNRIDFGWHTKSKDVPKYKAQVLEAQLLAWTKLVVSQKPKRSKTEFSNDIYMPLPIAVDDEFVVLSAYLDRKALTVPPNIAGLDMIEAVGTKVILPSEYLEDVVLQVAQFLQVPDEPAVIYNKIKSIAKSTRYTTKALIIAMLTYFATEGMNTHIKFLVDSHVYECMLGLFKVLPDNVVSVDSNWNRFLEFKVEPKHIAWFLNQWIHDLDNMYKGDGKEKFIKMETYRLPSGENELHIVFEGLHKLIVNTEGVFEADRNRQLYNAVVVSQQAIEYTNGNVKESDIIYLNSYAVLLQYLVKNCAVFAEKIPYTAKFFTKRLLNELTFVAIKDTGEVDGDRRMLEKSTAITLSSEDYVRVWSTKAANGTWNLPEHKYYSTLPFKFSNVDGFVNKLVVERHYQKQRQEYIAPWRVDEVAFVELNLARSKKHFIDGRRVALQAKYIPKTVRTEVLQIICSDAYNVFKDGLENAIYKDFPDLIEAQYTSEQLWDYLGENLVFGLSSKLSKLVKRTIMYAAQIGRLLESEDVFLKQTGQKYSSINCQAVKCIVSAFHCDAQGVAATLNEDGYLFNHIVPHRIERKLSLRPIPLSAKQPDSVTLDLETYLGKPTSTRVEGSWTIYSYEPGVPKGYKEQILSMPFQPKGSSSKEGTVNFNLFNEYDEALVTDVKVRYVTLAGKIKQVQLQVELTTLEHGVKGRGITKTMFAGSPASVVFNDLNPNLSKDAVQAIFYKDTNKWLDTSLNLLPLVYMTAYKNAETWPEGIAIIKEIDKIAGENNWSALLDKLGVYTPLRVAFDNKFGKQALWVQHEEHQCNVEQSCIALEFAMYKKAKGWNKLDLNTLPVEVLNAIPEEYVNIVAYIQGELDEYNDNKINVKIFASDETKTSWFTAQRSRVYVGTADCPLYMPVKAEMASVRSLIGTSPAMGGVIRNIATYDRDFATKMLSKNFKAYNKFAGFLGMSRSSSIQPLEGKEFKTVVMNANGRMSREVINLIRTDKVREIYKATENEGSFLLELSKLFSDINFVVITDKIVKENADDEDEVGVREQASFSMYLPVIVAQSAGAGFRTTDDLASNIQILFTNLLHGMDWVQIDEYGTEYDNIVTVNLCNRIGGAIKSLVKTKGIAKCGSFGVLGVMAKPVGLYGVPLNEVWIRKSERYDSVYRTMLRTYKLKPSELDMFPVLFSRAPMTATAKVKVRVVDQWHDMYSYLNEDSFTFNPLACYYHRGDYDGDLNYLYPAIIEGIECNIPYLTTAQLVESIKASTGNDQLFPGGSYYGDGFEVPTFKSIKKKRTFGPESITLNSLRPSMLDVNSTKKPSLGQLLAGSTQMLRQAVGVAHRLFITTDLYITAIEELPVLLKEATPVEFKVTNWLDVKLIQILGEIYEVPLGGFDKWAYMVFYNHIIPLINGDIEPKFAIDIIASGLATPAGEVIAPLTSLSGIMNKAGMNGTIIVHNGKDNERFEDGEVESVADDVNKAIKALIMCKSWDKKIKTIDGKDFDQWGEDKYDKFFSLAAEISLLLSKGTFLPEVEKSGAANYVDEAFEPYSREELVAMGYEYIDELDEAEDDSIDEQHNVSLQRKMLNAYVKGVEALGIDSELAISKCTVFGPIEYYRKTVCKALLGDTVYIDASYFVSTEKDSDDSNEEGGSTISIIPIKPDGGDGGGIETDTTEELDYNSIFEQWVANMDNSAGNKAKLTFQSLPKEIQKWWVNLSDKLKDPAKFDNWLYLSVDQWVAVYEMYTGRYKRITLCGQAGSGKSYVSKFVQKLLEESNKDVLMVASTGIAAYLSGGSTINSAFSMGADNDILPMGLTDKIHHSVKPQRKTASKEFQVQTRKSIESIVRKVQSNGLINKDSKKELIIFFDEIGMFSSENLTIAIEVVHQHFAYTKRPVRFVFLADYRQLLPISKPSETPWEVSSNLAIHEAKFQTMMFNVTDEGVTYSVKNHLLPSQLGVVKTNEGLTINGGIALSLITNHRQGENKLFIDNLNSVGDGTGSFTPTNSNFVSSIAERIFLTENTEVYNWIASKNKQNVLADNEELAKGIHVYFSNRAVSERNTIGTAQAIDNLKMKFGQNYKLHTRDYGVTITVAKGETNDPISRVLQDISPVGITTLSIKDPSYQHEKETHSDVASTLNKDIHTFAYQRVCVGMRWMCRMNLSTKLRNGTVCTVTYVSDKYFNVVVDNDTTKEHIRVEAQTELFVKKNGKGMPIAKVYGVPGHPAYALTYHKTQGITIPKGNIFVLHIDSAMINFANQGNMHGLLYVGLSRVETVEQLYIIYEANVPVEQGMNSMCKTNQSVFDFIKYTELSMQQYLSGEFKHNFDLFIHKESKQPETVKQEDYDLFSSQLPELPEVKRMKMF